MVSTETLLKLKTLAERGCGGEKDAAAALLKKLCEKNGISESDLDSEKKSMHWFQYKRGMAHFRLLNQCIYKTLGKDYGQAFRHHRKSDIGTECTDAQAIEIELDYEFYSKGLDQEIERLVSAFVQANGVFPVNGPVAKKDDRTIHDKYLQMGIERRTRAAQLGTGTDE